MLLSNDCWVKDKCKKYKEGCCNEQFCIKLFKLEKLYTNSLLTRNQWKSVSLIPFDVDEESFEKLNNFRTDIVNFVNNGKNLYIHSSSCGNGKTAWSIKFIQAYLQKIWTKADVNECKALFINVPRFLLALKDDISVKSEYIEHIKNNVLDADLVVWDEIGVSSLSKFEHEHLLNLINTRLDCGKSNIYTSNMNPDELKEKLGERLYSRVVNYSEEVIFYGPDRRGE